MKLNQVLMEEVVHPAVKGLMIGKKRVFLNGKQRNNWKGYFLIDGDVNQVSSIEGCPKVADGFQVIDQKYLKSLKGSPEKAKNLIIWNCSMLQDLTGITPDCESYTISSNERLASIKGIPVNKEIDLKIYENKNLSFTTCHFPSIKALHWVNNKDVSLHDFHRHFPKITRVLMISDHIKSHVLSLLLIDELKEIIIEGKLDPVVNIINQYLPNIMGKKGMLRCQAELIDAGYTEYAQL